MLPEFRILVTQSMYNMLQMKKNTSSIGLNLIKNDGTTAGAQGEF